MFLICSTKDKEEIEDFNHRTIVVVQLGVVSMKLLFTISIILFSVDHISGVVKLIFDTDMDFDVDDVGALCAAHGLVRLGEAEILAVGKCLIWKTTSKEYEHFQFTMLVIQKPSELCL